MAVATSYRPRVSRTNSATHRQTSRHEPDTVPDWRIAVPWLGRAAYVVLLLSTAIVIAASVSARADRPQPDAWSTVTVDESATLWAIAQEHPVAGLGTAETVALIREYNRLESALINPGQPLRVPAPNTSALALASR